MFVFICVSIGSIVFFSILYVSFKLVDVCLCVVLLAPAIIIRMGSTCHLLSGISWIRL